MTARPVLELARRCPRCRTFQSAKPFDPTLIGSAVCGFCGKGYDIPAAALVDVAGQFAAVLGPAAGALETWIPNGDGTSDLSTVDLETVWAETFAAWDGRVDTDTAAAMASATVGALQLRKAVLDGV